MKHVIPDFFWMNPEFTSRIVRICRYAIPDVIEFGLPAPSARPLSNRMPRREGIRNSRGPQGFDEQNRGRLLLARNRKLTDLLGQPKPSGR
jgi:hypothetical protein